MSDVTNFMADTNQSFDLPRWQTQVEPLSSSAQSAQPSYHLSGPPPPPPPPPPQSVSAASQRLQPHQSTTAPSRQPRISQLLDQDPIVNSSYLSSGHSQLARSASLGGAPNTNMPSSKPRRHHQPDDLEGAFNVENQPSQPLSASRPFNQLPHNSFYPASVGYQQQSLTATGAAVNSAASPSDSYSDMYYNGSATQPSKRSQAPHDPSSSARAGRSPIHPPSSATLIDSYSQQSQYSPTTATYSYAPADQRPHPATYHSHSRNHSQVKSDSMTPPISSPYTPQTSALGSAGPYSPSYPMETSSPRPPSHIQTHLTAHVPRHNSTSNPPTPLSYLHSQSPSLQYYSQEQAMVVDPPPPKRRASGFRRVRTVHDLQPRTDIPTTGRRMGSDGVYLSVCTIYTSRIFT
jgi:dual specificity protein kinase YAK1